MADGLSLGTLFTCASGEYTLARPMRTELSRARLADGASLYDGLVEVPGFPFAAWSSRGTEERAEELATRCEAAYWFLGEHFEQRPEVTLLALSAKDWSRFSRAPFGMPSYAAGHLVLPSAPSEFGVGLARLLDHAEPEVLHQARDVYGSPGGDIDLDSFFTLLSVHELGHGFERGTPGRLPRLWLGELFGNVCLHTYVAVESPATLPVLETFPLAFGTIDPLLFQHRSLADFERLYIGVGLENYAWYQCRLHVLAKQLYDADGIAPLRRMWDRFLLTSPEKLSDQELVVALERDVHPVVAEAVRTWPAS